MLRESTWNIFEIAKENGKDIGVGKDMFIHNVENGANIYGGADELDYEELRGEWGMLDDEEKTAERNAYNEFAKENYAELTSARANGDRDAFELIVNG